MASLGGLKRRLVGLRPRVQSAFIVWVTHRTDDRKLHHGESEFEVRQLTSPDDPVLPSITQSWNRDTIRQQVAAGSLEAIVVLKEGRCIGHVWQTSKTETALFSGVPRVKLAADEIFMYDLFVEAEFRRSSVGMQVADYVFERYSTPEVKARLKYLYGFIDYENAPSILWHHVVGFNIVQTINYLCIGERVKWKIPFSDVPRFGPMSKKGRHSDPSAEMFGTALFPNL